MDHITYLYGNYKKTRNHEFIPYAFAFVFGLRMGIRIRSWRTLPNIRINTYNTAYMDSSNTLLPLLIERVGQL